MTQTQFRSAVMLPIYKTLSFCASVNLRPIFYFFDPLLTFETFDLDLLLILDLDLLLTFDLELLFLLNFDLDLLFFLTFDLDLVFLMT